MLYLAFAGPRGRLSRDRSDFPATAKGFREIRRLTTSINTWISVYEYPFWLIVIRQRKHRVENAAAGTREAENVIQYTRAQRVS